MTWDNVRRIEIDPNVVSRSNVAATYVLAKYCPPDIYVGEPVIAVRPYDGESDYVSAGTITWIGDEIVELEVDWSGFHDDVG